MIHKFLSWPIRIHLIILLLLLALPCMLLILRSGLEERNNAIANARRDCIRVVETIATEQQALVAGAEQLATTLAFLPEVQSGNRKAVTALFSDLVKKNHQYASISVADKSGLVWASATPFEGKISLADRRYFQEVVRTGMFSSGEYATGKMLKRPVMIFGYPVKNAADDVTGVIAIVLDLGHVQNIFEKVGLPSGASFSLLDRRGVILVRNLKDSFSTNLLGRPDKRPDLFTTMTEGPDEGVREAIGNDEKPRLWAYKRISLPHESSPYLYIRSSMPLVSVTSGANAAMFKNLAFLMLFFGIGFILVWFIGRRVIMNPIKLLVKASGQLGAGAAAVNVSQAIRGGAIWGNWPAPSMIWQRY